MGSWNETCGLSNLPICPGEKVIFLLLTQNPYSDHVGRSGCYHGDFFFPRSIPLTGTYDDYGKVAIDEGQDAIIDLIKQGFAVDLIPQEAEKYRHGPMNMDTWTIDSLQDWLHEGKVRIDKNALNRESDKQMAKFYEKVRAKDAELNAKDPARAEAARKGEEMLAARQLVSPSPIYKLIIRRDVWDAFTSIQCRAWYGVYTLAKYQEGADQVIDKITSAPVEKDGDLPELKAMRSELRMMLLDLDRENPFVSRFMGIGGGGSGDPPFEVSNHWYNKRLVDGLFNGTVTADEARAIFHRQAELAQVEHVMAMTRRAWAPTTGMGSQSEETELCLEVFAKLARVTEAAILKGIEERREWDEDEAEAAETRYKNLKNRLGI